MIARQAIVNAQGDVVAHELLQRSRGPASLIAGNDVGLIFAALANVCNEQTVCAKPIFIKCSHESMANGQLELVSSNHVVLEVAPLGHAATSEVQARLSILCALRERGFQLAFNQTVLESAYAAWLPLADYIKLDLSTLRADQLAVLVGYAQRHSAAQIIAEKVETALQFATLKAMGIQLFQGYWFARPTLMESRLLSPGQASIIQLINLLRQQSHADAIEAILKKDAALAFNLMRLINSAGLGMAREITSFRQAMLILGQKKMFRWAALLLTASQFGNVPSSVGQTAVVRGRMMELLALELWGEEEADQAFVVGVFSLLDVMLQMPMSATLQLLDVPDTVGRALLHREGALGELLQLAQSCEGCEPQLPDRSTSLSPLDDPQINMAHLQALAWTDNLST